VSVIAIIAALLLEQWRPLDNRKGVDQLLSAWAGWLEQAFNGGERLHGLVAWLVAVLPPVLLAVLIHYLLASVHFLLALAFQVAVLYFTLGFRQFSHHFTELQLAVKSGDMERARILLEEWRGASGVVRTREEVIRLAIEEALISSQRHVFGPIFWYVLLPGPSGAILYRLSAYLYQRWKDMGVFGRFAEQAFHVIEWPAVRLTAAAFAVVGDFEDAIYCWRTQARTWPDSNEGVILGAGAGAMGVRLGMPVQEVEGMQPRPELGVVEPADGAFLDSTVGLVWRALVVWVFVLLLITVARVL
jgi:adenosylcobinamide-phosphate synthase